MKKPLSLLLAFLMVLALSACAAEYEDTNGDDNFALQTITDEDIINLQIGSSGINYTESSFGSISGNEYYSKNFNGVEQLFVENYIWDSDITISVGYLDVTAGNFRMVVINNDEIIFDVPLNISAETYYFEDINGYFSVHIAGESANVKFNYSVG